MDLESTNLGVYQQRIDDALVSLNQDQITQRILNHDYTVWNQDPAEITNRLGWLRAPSNMLADLNRLEDLVGTVQNAGYVNAYLLGMGGSSLAAKVFVRTFGSRPKYLNLAVIDSTDPDFILEHSERIDSTKALFIVSTKSGSTEETLSFFRYFHNEISSVVGNAKAGEHFVAITDPGTKLDRLADQVHFRAKFLNDPEIGGRYSALSFFGLVPAALVGVDLVRLRDHAMTWVGRCESSNLNQNPAAQLGAILGELAKAGRDKVTFVTSEKLASFAVWAEQLIAESTGKDGRGILPVVDEQLGSPEVYGNDRLFVYLQLAGDSSHEAELSALESAGQPIVRLQLPDVYDVGGHMFLWEMVIAIAGHIVGINPFDQPNVEMSKVLTRQMIADYAKTGKLPLERKMLKSDGISVYGSLDANTPIEALTDFLSQAEENAYLALQAYVNPTTRTDAAFRRLRVLLRDRCKLATTLGYGPSFLHSTGQLHKGDAGHGLFVQFTSEHQHDVPIPDEIGSGSSTINFGTLEAAQALGDFRSLSSLGRKIIRFHFDLNVADGLNYLSNALEASCSTTR